MYLIENLKKLDKKELTYDQKATIDAYNAILAGKVYAHVESVSKSGMSRRILFFMVQDGRIQRITAQIAWLYGAVNFGQYKQGGKYLIEDGLRVGGVGMDMIFHTLYTCLPHAEKWNQKYNTL